MKTLQKYGVSLMSLVWIVPSFAYAQVIPGGRSLWDIAGEYIKYITNNLIPILVTIAVIVLIVNIIRYILWNNKGEIEHKKAASQLAWSIGGLFIILAIWGIIAVISKTLGIGIGGNPIDLPGVPFP
ncbi:MAG TPA: hypothetical protein VGE63_01460 [Candidatus Paceibacterota bacterium]